MGTALTRANSPVLYSPPQALHYLAALLMLPVFPLLLATYLPGRIKATVQHPMLTATKAWAVAHLLVNGTRGGRAFVRQFPRVGRARSHRRG